MENNKSNNSYVKDEIDLGVLLKTLIDQKIMIIIITLLFGLMAALYANSIKPIYKSSVIISLPNSDFIDANRSIHNAEVIFNSDIEASISKYGVTLFSTSNSKEKAEILLKKPIDYFLINENNIIKNNLNNVLSEIKILSKIGKSVPASSGIESRISALRMSTKNTRYYEILKKQTTNQLTSKKINIIFLGLTLGFMLSIFIVFSRRLFL